MSTFRVCRVRALIGATFATVLFASLATAQVRPQIEQRPVDALTAMGRSRGMGPADSFRAERSFTDRMGQTHIRFAQTYHGLRVWGGEAVMHYDARGRALEPQWRVQTGIVVPVKPVLGADGAVKAALAKAPAGARMSAPSRAELVVYPVTQPVRTRTMTRDGQPYNAMEVRELTTAHRLAYYLNIEQIDSSGPRHRDYLVDAMTGQVLKEWDSLETGAATGTGKSLVAGPVALSTNSLADGSFELRDTTRGTGGAFGTNATTDMAHTLDQGTSGTVFTDADDTWGDGAVYSVANDTTSANGQTAAVDVAYGLQQTWDYYSTVHGRNGIDDRGTATVSRVHYGNRYMNAFWSDDCFCMTYGDGDGHTIFTQIDTSGHEMTHGVTSRSAGLIYWGESGGLNESTSDIFGKMVDFYTRGDAAHWTLGEMMAPPDSPRPIRYMYKPSLDRLSPDAWYDGIDQLDVHYVSGPMNRAFYFMAMGSSGDPGKDDYSLYLTQPGGMAGIGRDKAAQIWYRALTVYLTPTSGYADARLAALHAVRDLFGGDSPENVAVRMAFGAINVGDPYTGADDFTPPHSTASVNGDRGTIQFHADATDDHEVAKLSFTLDGDQVAARKVEAPAPAIAFDLDFDSTTIANGHHWLAVTACDKNVNCGLSNYYTFTVTNPKQQLLRNGGFEYGWNGWWGNWLQQKGSDYGMPAHSGKYYGMLATFIGPDGGVVPMAMYQNVTVPDKPGSVQLSFWLFNHAMYRLDSRDWITVQVRTVGQDLKPGDTVLKTLATYDNTHTRNVYQHCLFDLSEFAGQQVQIYFEDHIGSQDDEGAYAIDDVALTVSDSALPQLTIAPALAKTLVGQPVQFSATIAGMASGGDTSVVWSLVDAPNSGKIDPVTGLFTAPLVVGDYWVRATSAADPAVSAAVPVSVTGPNGEQFQCNPFSFTVGTRESEVLTGYMTDTSMPLVFWATSWGTRGTAEFSNPVTFTAGDTPIHTNIQGNTKHEGWYSWAGIEIKGQTAAHLTPSRVNLLLTTQQAFTPSWTGDVKWSLQEGDAGGTVDDKGVYTAPATPGVYHVTCTGDGGTATAEVTVSQVPALHARIVSPGWEAVVPDKSTITLVGSPEDGLTGQVLTGVKTEWWVYDINTGHRTIYTGNTVSVMLENKIYPGLGYFMAVYHVTDASKYEAFSVIVAHVRNARDGAGFATAVEIARVAGTQMLTAMVTGTGAYSRDVVWSAARGHITAAGLYTPPADGGADTITATSLTDPGVKASLQTPAPESVVHRY